MAPQKTTAGETSVDSELSKIVVDTRLATQAEVEQCQALRARLLLQNNDMSLAQVMVEQGIVTQNQIERVKRTIEESRDQQFPNYKIISKLGSGAMATVFKARQINLDRYVAIKVLPRKLSENPEYVERFYKEGKAAAKLNHANIVQAFDVGEAGGYHYFVMEYVEGKTLYDDLAAGKIYSEEEALRIIIQIARALEHAHKQGLIHRDVKPKNIMITPEGIAKLADMGLARGVADAEAAQAEAGRAFGTPYYISPEQIRGELNIDFRADIYSLGATLYHLVTGRVPFEGPTPAAVMHKHLKEALIPPDHLNTTLSAGMGEVVEVMMAKNRDRRYASTTDLLLDLEAISAGNPPPQAHKHLDAGLLSGLTTDSRDQTVDIEAPAPPNNLMVYIILLGGALALSVIVNIVLVLRAL